VKNLKFGVLAFGVLGLIGCFIPTSGVSFFAMREFPGGGAIVYGTMAGFAIAAVAGILGVTKPPFGKPQAGIGLVGFIVALTMMTDKKPWKVFEVFKSPLLAYKILAISALAGLVISILALVKSEEA
jgi:hypothetical protein